MRGASAGRRRRPRRAGIFFAVAAALLGAPLVVLLSASPAAAAPAEGCKGTAVSADDDREPLDTVDAPGKGGTKDDPFQVTYDGQVRYDGTTNGSFDGGTWKLELESGTGFNPLHSSGTIEGGPHQAGDTSVSEHVPFKIAGLYKVRLVATSPSGKTCTIEAWVKVIDSPLGTPLWIAAIVLILGGGALLFFAMPTEKLVK